MDKLITNELIVNTFLFCWKKMANKDDAKDLAQEIVVDAMLILRSGKKIENFYGLYWQIARNKVADFYRRKRPVKVSLDDVENTLLGFDKSIGDFITQEELDNLSVSMNRLASRYSCSFLYQRSKCKRNCFRIRNSNRHRNRPAVRCQKKT